jgi:copper(I)-binding protein
MQRLLFRGATCAFAILTLSAPALAQAPVRAGPLVIETPWSRATPAGAKVAGGYLRITNTGTEPDRLTGASAEIAGKSEVHEMSNENGVMKMRELDRGIEIRPGETVELKPGGLHLMFMDLKSGFREGETVRGTLVFEKAGTVAVTFRVGGLGARGAPHHAHH